MGIQAPSCPPGTTAVPGKVRPWVPGKGRLLQLRRFCLERCPLPLCRRQGRHQPPPPPPPASRSRFPPAGGTGAALVTPHHPRGTSPSRDFVPGGHRGALAQRHRAAPSAGGGAARPAPGPHRPLAAAGGTAAPACCPPPARPLTADHCPHSVHCPLLNVHCPLPILCTLPTAHTLLTAHCSMFTAYCPHPANSPHSAHGPPPARPLLAPCPPIAHYPPPACPLLTPCPLPAPCHVTPACPLPVPSHPLLVPCPHSAKPACPVPACSLAPLRLSQHPLPCHTRVTPAYVPPDLCPNKPSPPTCIPELCLPLCGIAPVLQSIPWEVVAVLPGTFSVDVICFLRPLAPPVLSMELKVRCPGTTWHGTEIRCQFWDNMQRVQLCGGTNIPGSCVPDPLHLHAKREAGASQYWLSPWLL